MNSRRRLTPALQGLGLLKIYPTRKGAVYALNHVSLIVRPGEFVSIVGPSGSGKSTLLHCLSGLELADKGSVCLHGNSLYHEFWKPQAGAVAALRAKHIGFVFQRYHLLANLTALQNVMLPLRVAGYARSQCRLLATEALEQVELSHRLTHRPSQLSGGEQQRVAIARALAGQPSIILADEPTGNLDQEQGKKMIDLLGTLAARKNTAVVLVTHSREHASRSDRFLFMESGVLFGNKRMSEAAW